MRGRPKKRFRLRTVKFETQINQILQATYAPKPPELPSEWAEREFVIAEAATAGGKGRLRLFPYQRDMLDAAFSDNTSSTIIVQKSQRVGYSLMAMAGISYAIAHKRRHTKLFFPDDKVARNFSREQIGPTVDAMPPLKKGAESLDSEEKKRKGFTVSDMLFYGTTWLKCRGVQAVGATLADSFDIGFIDEVSSFPGEVKGWSVMDMVRRGSTTSPHRKTIIGGCPSSSNEVLTEEMAECGHVFLFHVPHPCCGSYAPLIWNDGMTWDDMDKRRFKENPRLENRIRAKSARMKCPSCGRFWRDDKRRAAVSKGRWQTDDGVTLRDGKLFDAEGNELPWPEAVGFKINAMYNATVRWESLVYTYLRAYTSKDRALLRTFYEQHLGQPFRSDKEIDVNQLWKECTEPLRPKLPKEVLVVGMAVDVQQEYLSVLIGGFSYKENCMYFIRRYELEGNTQHATNQVWLDLKRDIEARPTFEREDGAKLPLYFVACDQRPYPDATLPQLLLINHRRFMLCMGAGGTDGSIRRLSGDATSKRVTAEVPGYGVRKSFFATDTQKLKDILFERLAAPHGQAVFDSEMPMDVIEELEAEKEELVKGRLMWMKRPNARNELIDQACLLMVGVTRSNIDWDLAAEKLSTDVAKTEDQIAAELPEEIKADSEAGPDPQKLTLQNDPILGGLLGYN